MSVRKHIRDIMRVEAEKNGYKGSKAVSTLWDRFKKKQVGEARRKRDVCHGTHPKKLWRYREGIMA